MRLTEWHRKFLRDMKRAGLSVKDMPEDVAKAALVIHQKALLEWIEDKASKGKRRKK